MKIARHLREFLEKKGYLEIPSIGRFDVHTEELTMPRGETMTRRKLSFAPLRKNGLDESLVQFLCERLKSEACVIYADIRSFSHYLNELLMQGLEVEIPGVGYLNRNHTNEVNFTYKSSYEKKRKHSKPVSSYLMNYWM